MFDLLTDAFSSGITQRALVGGLLAATITSLVGTWVVVRGLAFFGDAMAHGVLPGIALAAIWGFDLTLGAVISAAVMIFGINVIHRSARLSDDTAIGLLFVGMLALGVVIISREVTFSGDLTGFLFGDVLAVRDRDLWRASAVLIVVGAVLVLGHRSFLALAVNREKAAALGLRPGLAHAALLVLLALAVVSTFEVVGTLLVFGLLVAPPASAVLIVRRIPVAMGLAVVFGWLSVLIGLTVSYHADLAASATVAAVSVVMFFVVFVVSEGVAALRRSVVTTPVRESVG
jgi:manganese/iron transport system permease protein